MLTHNIHVKMGAYGIQPSIHAVEGETGRFVNIYTDDRAVTATLEAELSVHRPDDSYYSIPEVVVIPDSNGSPGYYHLSLVQALTRPGKVECQLKISSSGLVLSTYTFYIMVEPSADGIPVAQLGYDIYDLLNAVDGLPTPVQYGSLMTNEEIVYLYIGTETGYAQGHLYYWDGSAWADGGTYGGSGGGGSITVDSALSSTSKNPVQNKAIYSALQNKANASDIPTVASAVTAGGTNPVNSVAVIAYINSLDATNTAY